MPDKKGVLVRFYLESDADLIKWLEGLATGEGNDRIKAMLRAGIASSQDSNGQSIQSGSAVSIATLDPASIQAALEGFLDIALPAAREKGIAVMAMKVLGAGHYIFPDQGITPEVLIRFALSQEVTVVISGCSTKKEVQTLADAGRAWEPFSPEEQKRIIDFFRPYARKLAYYRGVF